MTGISCVFPSSGDGARFKGGGEMHPCPSKAAPKRQRHSTAGSRSRQHGQQHVGQPAQQPQRNVAIVWWVGAAGLDQFVQVGARLPHPQEAAKKK